MSRRRGWSRWPLLPLVFVFLSPVASAEFYRWTDAQGHERVSNVAPAGIGDDGRVRKGFHPYSVQAQHARLRASLARRGAELAAAERDASAAGEGVLERLLPMDLLERIGDP